MLHVSLGNGSWCHISQPIGLCFPLSSRSPPAPPPGAQGPRTVTNSVCAFTTCSPELLLADHFSQVLYDELAGFERLFGTDAPAFLFSPEALQALHPFVPLNPLVAALLTTRAGVWGALSKDHPGSTRTHKIVESGRSRV